MKRMSAGCLLVMLAFACGTTRTGNMNNGSPAEQAGVLERLTAQWTSAALRHDKAQLEELMAPEYVLHTPDPKHPETNRAEWLNNLFTHLKIDHWEQTDVRAHVYGDVGVVTSNYSWKGTFHERAFDSKGLCTDVWRFNKDHWRVVSRTSVAFPGSVTLQR